MILAENNKINNIEKNNRIYYIDILRVIACLSVIMIHSSSEYVIKDIGSFNFWVGNIFDGLSRIGVPLFIMISGALMLDNCYNYSAKKLIKHIFKLIIFFVFWSGIYCIVFKIMYPIIINNEPIDIMEIIDSFISGYSHLWFIYLIIGLYLVLPLLRLWVKDENKKYVEYFIILSIIFTYIIPQIISIGSNYSNIFEIINNIIETKLNLKYIGGFTTYFIVGWYIHNYDIKNKKLIYILGMCGAILTIIGTYILSVSLGKPKQLYGNLTINVFFQTIMIFLFIKTKYNNVESGKNKFILTISKYSLGIYAIHAAIISIMYYILVKFNFEIAVVNIPFIFVVSFIVAFFGTYILNKIPIFRKFI